MLNLQQLRAKVEKKRVAQGLTPHEIAAQYEVSASCWLSFERGAGLPTVPMVARAAHFVGIDATTLGDLVLSLRFIAARQPRKK